MVKTAVEVWGCVPYYFLGSEQLPSNQLRLQEVTVPRQEILQHIISVKNCELSFLHFSFVDSEN